MIIVRPWTVKTAMLGIVERIMLVGRPKQRKHFPWFVVALAILVVVHSAPSAWAWGRLGHRVISRLAEQRLTPKAKAAIAELLEPGESLADASPGPMRCAGACEKPRPGKS